MKPSPDAHTTLCGLFGHPIGHSLSPQFMNRAFGLLGINSDYLAFDVAPKALEEALCAFRALNMTGANVTIPHKTRIAGLLDKTEEDAQSIGAVNCIYRKKNLLVGANTDHVGFLKPLARRKIPLRGRDVLLFGCGGAARAVCYAAFREGVKTVFVTNRSDDRASSFLEWFSLVTPGTRCEYLGKPDAVTRVVLAKVSVIVNATPLGMFPDTAACPIPESADIPDRTTVYDLVYNPEETLLLKRARMAGAQTINGLEMLVSQGVFSLLHWFEGKKDDILAAEGELLSYTRRFLRLVPSEGEAGE
ncbi:MAG: shikimate dehydrogenase [Spirochaetes bacterium]|nr:shikimate dehydrogenase [Spirochaetota bacterium]